jgi:hypothetical protein
MGDGPGYDYGYARSAGIASSKLELQRKRREILLSMLLSIGFGDGDGELTIVDKEIVHHLKMALELLDAQKARGINDWLRRALTAIDDPSRTKYIEHARSIAKEALERVV